MNKLTLGLLCVLLTLTSSSHAGKVYKWSDADGTHYSDRRPITTVNWGQNETFDSRRLSDQNISNAYNPALGSGHNPNTSQKGRNEGKPGSTEDPSSAAPGASTGSDSVNSATGSGGGPSGGGGSTTGGGGGRSGGGGSATGSGIASAGLREVSLESTSPVAHSDPVVNASDLESTSTVASSDPVVNASDLESPTNLDLSDALNSTIQANENTVADGGSAATNGNDSPPNESNNEALEIASSVPVSTESYSTATPTSKTIGPYEEPVSLPKCDPANPSVYIIKDNYDWTRLNRTDYRIFCVTPGEYTYEKIGRVQLKTSGTASEKRYLRWFDPENPNDVDTHVADIPLEKHAVIGQLNISADHWVIDRMVIRKSPHNNTLEGGAAHNVINRVLIEHTINPLLFHFSNSTDNVLQNSILRHTPIYPGRDGYAIYIDSSSNERIVNNEIYNFGGGIQQNRYSGGNHVVYGNELYITNDLYTDCMGNMDPDGPCACSEGFGVVLKGTDDPSKSFLIEENIIWGFQQHDGLCMGTGAPGTTSIDLGSGGNATSNVVIRHNIVLSKTPNGIYLGRHVKDVEISNNIVAGADRGIINVYGQNITISGNIYSNNGENYHTGSIAEGTIYENNQELTGEMPAPCFVLRKFTDPQLTCLP